MVLIDSEFRNSECFWAVGSLALAANNRLSIANHNEDQLAHQSIFDAIRVLYLHRPFVGVRRFSLYSWAKLSLLYCFLGLARYGFHALTAARIPTSPENLLLRSALRKRRRVYFEWHAERSLSNDVLYGTKKTHGALRKVSQFTFLVLAGREKNQAPWRPCLLN